VLDDAVVATASTLGELEAVGMKRPEAEAETQYWPQQRSDAAGGG
jgi:hypothetical protein